MCQVFAWYYNANYESWDIDDALTGNNNIQIKPARSPRLNGAAVVGSTGANSITTTDKKAALRDRFRAAGTIAPQ